MEGIVEDVYNGQRADGQWEMRKWPILGELSKRLTVNQRAKRKNGRAALKWLIGLRRMRDMGWLATACQMCETENAAARKANQLDTRELDFYAVRFGT